MLSLLKFGHFLFLVTAVSAIYLYNIILPNALPSQKKKKKSSWI